jgi:diguanylate cyclase (GGDEF)-like protein
MKILIPPHVDKSPGMIIDGVFSSEAIDSSGEIVKLKGLDISIFEDGQGVANYEHIGKDGGGFGKEVVGHVIYVKKIFELSDCDNNRQKDYYKKVGEVPYLYGMVRLYDAAGHSGAKDLAAQIRDHVAHDEQVLVRYSVEGSTLERDNNVIKTSIGRKVALTITPCNKTCASGLISDSEAPAGYQKKPEDVTKSEPPIDIRHQYVGEAHVVECNPIVHDSLSLCKTITAGSYDACPSTLSGGAALQREDLHKLYKDHIVNAIQAYDQPFDRKAFKAYLKAQLHKADLPEVSDSFLDHFVDIANDLKLKKSDSPVINNLWTQVHHLESMLIEFRKSVREELNGYNIDLPKVYLLNLKIGDHMSPAGRFMLHDGNIHHLEDYHNILQTLVPEGLLNPQTEGVLAAIKNVALFHISEHAVVPPSLTPTPEANVSEQVAPARPAIFEYWRPGMAKPHIVEFSGDYAALDGSSLTHDELGLMLDNAKNGLASITWKGSPNGGEIKPDLLVKADQSDMKPHPLQAAITALRSAVQAGHISPEHEQALTQHIYGDHMVPGVGNKFAATEFLKKQKPGVYGSIDLNSFKSINDRFGHHNGDSAIKSVGGALRQAADKVGNVKLFRNGGDEFVVHGENLADMHAFMNHAKNHMDQISPIGGVHKPSFSIGLGHNFETADKALYEAKKQKLDPVSGKSMFLPHATPHMAHSLVPGHEGPIAINAPSGA